jgi:hypothetical protein
VVTERQHEAGLVSKVFPSLETNDRVEAIVERTIQERQRIDRLEADPITPYGTSCHVHERGVVIDADDRRRRLR